ncbi:RagB/SusD family nutrient uptake outer membrane protein [Seonamhaeicola sp. NFXS20]|uniref:RagB/SusD family nutrient uptake outer membrane protein n=1 Tax=Seonamhaeicola sp. NFXS20 TaxID=2816959 RepID=UPI003B8B1F18
MKIFNQHKNKLRVLSIYTLFISVFGCQDFLEENPESLLSPSNFPQSAEDANLILGGISNNLASSDFGNRSIIFLAETSSDEGTTRYTSGDRYSIDHYEYVNSNQYITNVYNTCYKIINQANALITYLPNDEDWAKPYVAAGKFYRAWMYSYLVRLYGPAIIRDTPTEVVNPDEVVVRVSEEEVYNFIISDLEEAQNDLPLNWTGDDYNDDGRPTQGAAKILLAKMYISMAGYPVNDTSKWELGLNKAQEVIDSGVYQLKSNFSDLFLIANKNQEESILSIQMAEVDGQLSIQHRPTGGGISNGGWYLFSASEKLMNSFDDNDDRKEGTFVINFVQETGTTNYTSFSRNRNYGPVPAVQKFQDFNREDITENARRTSLGLPIFRFAEAYLIKAEAENEVNGPTEEAIEAINILRRRAHADEIPEEGLTKDELRDIIQQEWSFELAFELKRRFNILRWGIMDEVLGNDERASLGYQSYKQYYPIPQAEFDSGLDPSLQNPGY